VRAHCFSRRLAKEALACREQIPSWRIKVTSSKIPIDCSASMFAVVFNCSGLMDDTELDVNPREPNSTAAGYSPVICRDENSLLAKMADLASDFEL